MDMNKTTATKHVSSPQTDAPRAIREMAEKGAAQTNETYEKMSAATSEAADHASQLFDRAAGRPGLQ